jgi:hypothetical protein
MEYVARGRTECVVAGLRRSQVFRTVGQEAISVELVSVDIDCDRLFDEQIDRTGVIGQDDLLANAEAEGSQARARETLGQRVAETARGPDETAVTEWQAQSEFGKPNRVETTRTTRPIQCGDGVMSGLGEADELECLHEGHRANGRVAVVSLPSPVQAHVFSLG